MSNQFTEPSISSYNSSPPSDDGSNTATNEITWDGIKTKLADPIKNYVDSVISNVTTAFGKNHLNAVSAHSTTYSVASSDRGKLLLCTNTITLDLPAVASVGDGFSFIVRNDGSGTITLDGNSSETINGSATVDIAPGWGGVLVTDGSEWYMLHAVGNQVSGTLVTLTATQTLTNKTLTSPSITASSFSAVRTTTQAVSASTWTKFQFNSEIFDTNSDFDPTTNYRFTPTIAGKYQFNVGMYVTQVWTATTIAVEVALYKNGTLYRTTHWNPPTTSHPCNITFSCMASANGTTDYFEVYVYHTDTTVGSVNFGSSTAYVYFDGSWVET